MRAIISDIHGNQRALEAVLVDIASLKADDIYCLGDIAGTGPRPLQCIDLVRSHCTLCLLGDQDQAILQELAALESNSGPMIDDSPLKASFDADEPAIQRCRQFLETLPRMQREDDVVYVHGSPRNPVSEYVFPEDVAHTRKMERVFALFEQSCFHGHTHHPGVLTADHRFFSPTDLNSSYTLGKSKVMINVGSVGQPLDGNSSAQYATLDGTEVRFRRVTYSP